MKELLETPAWIVMYRGNGYGLFLSEQIAEEFAEFIAIRNEQKFRTNKLGEYEATIISTTIGEGLRKRKFPLPKKEEVGK